MQARSSSLRNFQLIQVNSSQFLWPDYAGLWYEVFVNSFLETPRIRGFGMVAQVEADG